MKKKKRNVLLKFLGKKHKQSLTLTVALWLFFRYISTDSEIGWWFPVPCYTVLRKLFKYEEYPITEKDSELSLPMGVRQHICPSHASLNCGKYHPTISDIVETIHFTFSNFIFQIYIPLHTDPLATPSWAWFWCKRCSSALLDKRLLIGITAVFLSYMVITLKQNAPWVDCCCDWCYITPPPPNWIKLLSAVEDPKGGVVSW